MRTASIGLSLLLALASCGSKQKPAETTPTTGDDTAAGDGATTGDTAGDATGDTAAPDAGKRKAWADLTVAEKKEIMKKQVVPRMRELWKQSPDPGEDVDCTTCHGDQAMDGKFEMPNKDLPALDFTPAGMAAYKKKEKNAQAWLDFMGKQVKPEMAKILGVDEYTPENPTGFGCGNCHGTVKM